MEKLLKYLNAKIPAGTEFLFIAKMILLFLLYIVFLISIKAYTCLESFSSPGFTQFVIILNQFLIACEEESFYRFVPLVLAIEKWGASKKIIYISIIASIFFGLIHGNYFDIFFQGVFGLFLCIIFLKIGGLEKKYFKAYIAIVLIHTFINYGLLYGVKLF